MGEALSPAGEKTILVIDDDPEMIKLLDLALKAEGFQVVTACDGLDAGKKLAQKAPDLIITDLMMPAQGGYEFLRTLQAEGVGGVPVFVISAGNLKPGTVEMIRQEANVIEFLAKPLPMGSFTASLHRVLKTLPPELAKRRANGGQTAW